MKKPRATRRKTQAEKDAEARKRKRNPVSAAKKEAEAAAKRKRTGRAAAPKKATVSKQGGLPYKLKKPTNFGMRALPETHLTKRGLSLKEILRHTPRLFANNSLNVEAHRVTKLKTKTGKPTVKGIMWTNDKYRPNKVKRYHETYIVGLDDNQTKKLFKHKKVLVQCSCDSFTFTFEYANALHGASYLIYSNGDAPVFMNPGNMPGACKHLVALMRIVFDRDM